MKMNKLITKDITVVFLILLGSYFLISFVVADLNISNWTMGNRAAVIVISVLSSYVYFSIKYIRD